MNALSAFCYQDGSLSQTLLRICTASFWTPQKLMDTLFSLHGSQPL